MYNVSTDFLNTIKQSSRDLTIEVLVGATKLTAKDIIDFELEAQFTTNNLPAIGAVFSNKFKMKLIKSNILSTFINKEIKPSVGVKVGDDYVFIPLGVFYADAHTITKTKNTIEVECYDKMIQLSDINYTPRVTFPCLIDSVIDDLKTNYRLEFAPQSYNNILVKSVKENASIRQVLSDIAELLGANAVINREGKIEFRKYNNTSFAINADNYIDFKLLSENNITISKLVCGNFKTSTGNGYAIEIENDNVTQQSDLDAIYNSFLPITYFPFECKMQGMPHLDIGDIIQLTDINDNTYNLYVTYHRLVFNGGLISEIITEKPSENISLVGSTGEKSITQSIKGINNKKNNNDNLSKGFTFIGGALEISLNERITFIK